MIAPVIEEIAGELAGTVTVAKVNVDEQKATAARLGIRSIPTMILFKNGREVKRIVGVKTRDYLLKEFDRARILCKFYRRAVSRKTGYSVTVPSAFSFLITKQGSNRQSWKPC